MVPAQMAASPNIVILGAGSLLAPWLVKRLSRNGLSGQCHSSRQICFDPSDTFVWKALDLDRPIDFNPESIVISLLPLWLLPPLLPQLQTCRHLIALSTTSIFSKADSPNPEERKFIRMVTAAEKKITRAFTATKIPWTILRPTLIYDGQYDRNVTALAKFIERWRILPVASPARGLRQPVHADDVAAAVAAAIENPSSYGRSFNLGGGEILTYRQMVQRIFHTLGRPSRILPIPLNAILALCWIIKRMTPNGPNAAMFIRMNQDLIYDFTNARHALNFKPRPFQPDFDSGVKNRP